MTNTKKLVVLSVFAAQAIILSIIENMIPVPLAFPGVKLGLANLVVIVILNFFGLREALTIVFIRVLISSLYGGGFVVFLFSISGGILSTLAMYFALKLGKQNVSLWSVSILGAILHNLGQLIVAAIVMKDIAVLSYLPILMVSGVVMGIFVGITGYLLIEALIKTRVFYSYEARKER
ncbi:MAG: Gx transporter family protein [Vallitaleaceae bacterium]|nr:Gx transporter family protein [Vallitaleaceae bacterium]